MRGMILIAALLFATPAISQPGKASLTATERALLQQNLDRGMRLYEFDQAAWHTTDTLRSDLSFAQMASVRGWVVTEGLDGEHVSYFGRDGNRIFLVYSADWDGKQVTGRHIAQHSEELSALERKLIAARDVAMPVSQKLKPCSNARFNTVVLPGRTDADPVSVYFLTPQTTSDSYPFGGHYRIDVKDGAIVGQREFTKACLEMSRPELPADAQPAAMFITHLLDPIPTEIHVFNAYASGLPIYVMASDGRLYGIGLKSGQASVRLMQQNSR